MFVDPNIDIHNIWNIDLSKGHPGQYAQQLADAAQEAANKLLKEEKAELIAQNNKILKDILGDEFIDENGDTISEWMEDVSIFMKTIESAYHDAVE